MKQSQFLVQFILRYQFVVLHGIQQLIECIRSDLVLFIRLNVLKLRLTGCIFGITIQIYFAVFVLAVLIQRKQSDVFFIAAVEDAMSKT